MRLIDRVRAFFGGGAAARAANPRDNPGQASVLADKSLWEQFSRIGGSLSPQTVSAIIRSADTGDMARLVDLSNEMRQKDGHLHSVLQTREMAVAGLEWELNFPGETRRNRRKRGSRIRVFVQQVLESLVEFDRLRAHLAGAPYMGYAVAEINWHFDGQYLLPAQFLLHSQRRFGFRQSDGVLVYKDLTDARLNDKALLETWPDKFIVSQPRVNGDVPCREGLVRVLMWLALFRNWALSDLLKLAEMAWKPWRRGIYKKSGAGAAGAKDIADLKAILRGMVSSGAAVHSDQVEIHLDWLGGTGSKGSGASGGSHESLFELCGREISKATLGQTLTTEQGRVGSQALGNVHNEVRRDLRDADARHLAEVLNRFLIEPLVRMNFGPAAPVPKIRFLTEDSSDLAQLADALEKLTGPNVKLKVGQNWVRDQAGMPDPAEDEELCGVYVDVSAFGSTNDGAAVPSDATSTQEPNAA